MLLRNTLWPKRFRRHYNSNCNSNHNSNNSISINPNKKITTSSIETIKLPINHPHSINRGAHTTHAHEHDAQRHQQQHQHPQQQEQQQQEQQQLVFRPEYDSMQESIPESTPESTSESSSESTSESTAVAKVTLVAMTSVAVTSVAMTVSAATGTMFTTGKQLFLSSNWFNSASRHARVVQTAAEVIIKLQITRKFPNNSPGHNQDESHTRSREQGHTRSREQGHTRSREQGHTRSREQGHTQDEDQEDDPQARLHVAAWLAPRLPELGPTYVKIGQFISAREDIFGEEVSACFRSLQDDAPTVSFDEIRDILVRQGPAYMSAFASIAEKPLASASIAQVHRAHLANGAHVVLKVKRPNLDQLIEADLAPLRFFIDILAQTGISSEATHAQGLLSDFVDMMKEEVDFGREVRNNMEFQKVYAKRNDVIVPRAVPRLCTPEVIVMEYVPSTRILDYVSEFEDDDGEIMAYRIMTLFVGQVLYRGSLVHGDPQPGNIGITADGRIVLYDFGSALRLTETERTRLKLLMYHVITGNAQKSLRALSSLGVEVLDENLALAYMRTYAVYVRTMDFRAFNTGRTDMPFALTDTLLRLVRIFGILEGMCKKLYSGFDYTSMAVFTWDAFILDADFVAMKAMDDIEDMSMSP